MFHGPLTLKSLGKLVELNALFCESLTFLIWHFCKWQVKFSGFTFLQLVFPAPVQGYQRVQVSSVLWWALCLFLSLQTVIFRVFLGVRLKTLSGFPVCLPCLHVLRSLERSTALSQRGGVGSVWQTPTGNSQPAYNPPSLHFESWGTPVWLILHSSSSL